MLAVNVSSNYKQLSRSLDQLGRKQLPFAFAKTLNQTMKAVGKYTVARTYPQAFDVRNKSFFKAAMFTGDAVRWATKTKLRASARDRFDRGNLQLYATGGTKRARLGRIAIPPPMPRRTPSGAGCIMWATILAGSESGSASHRSGSGKRAGRPIIPTNVVRNLWRLPLPHLSP